MSLDDTRHKSLVKCLTLARALDGEAIRPTLAEMARRLGVTTRTAHRYVIALEAAAWPLPPMDERRAQSSTRNRRRAAARRRRRVAR